MAKIFGNFSGALMALPVLLLTICWLKIIKRDGHYLLCNFVERECPPPSQQEEMELNREAVK